VNTSRVIQAVYRLTLDEALAAQADTNKAASHPSSNRARLVVTLLPWFVQRRLVKRAFSTRPDRDKLVHFAIDSSAIEMRVDGLYESSLNWNAVVRVVHTPRGFLLYPNELLTYWLPHHAFASEGDRAAFIKLAHQFAASYQEIG
jgi:hypothetical protein